jgi:hypothetical protein
MYQSLLNRIAGAFASAGIPQSGLAVGPTGSLAQYPHVVARSDGQDVGIIYNNATPAQITQGDNLALTMQAGEFKPRRLADIYKDLQALTAAQHTNVWNDLSAAVPGDVPRKYLADPGPNAASIFVMDWNVYQSGATGAKLTAAQKDLIAMYVQDNPFYLKNPAFDSSINIDGWEPA